MSFAGKPVVLLAITFCCGIIFWGGFNWAMEATNTESFCISCHEMEQNVYQEYKTTKHYANSSGVRATCPDCHVPKEWLHKVIRKIRATNELYHTFIGSINTPEKFNAKRSALANTVWNSMRATDSRECRNCHRFDFMDLESQSPIAFNMHQLSVGWNKTCIDCHQGIAHHLPTNFDKNAIMNALHDQIEKDGIDCRFCHKGMAAAPANDGWDD